MNRKLINLALSLAAVLGWAMGAAAQSDPLIDLTGVESPGFNYGGYYTGIYQGTLNGVPTNFMCDDFLDEVSFGDRWNVNTWSLNQVATPVHGQFTEASFPPTYHFATYASGGTPPNGEPGQENLSLQQAYNAVAYLASLVFTNFHGTYSSYANDPYVNQISYAIWAIMDTPPAGPECNGGASQPCDYRYWIQQGISNDNTTTAGIVFYSPDGNKILPGSPDAGGTAQEFIGYVTPVPEPVSLALTGTFLLLTGLFLRKRLLS